MREVSHISIGVGFDDKGQVLRQNHFANAAKKLFIEPGKFAVIEFTDIKGKVSVAEVPIGALGWEYEPL